LARELQVLNQKPRQPKPEWLRIRLGDPTNQNHLLKLIEDISRVAQRSPKPAETGITIASREYWPLPWYFRDYTRVGYYGQISPSSEPVVIGSEDKRLETEAAYGGRYRQIESGLNANGTYSLRPGVDLLLYVRRDLPAP